MTEDEIPDGLRLCRASGWNQQEQDWRLLLRLASGRFRVAIADGRVVATGGAALYGTQLAWICMILVDPDARGRGIGTRIFEEVLGLLDDIDVVGLDATPAGRSVYSKFGFREVEGLVRMAVRVTDSARTDVKGARKLTAAELGAICALDSEAFGADRGTLLAWALEQAPEYAWSLSEGGRLEAYCFGRRGHHSDHVGPVVAPSTEAALTLVSACLAHTTAECVIIDVPEGRNDWVAGLRHMSFEAQRPLTRMYRERAVLGRPELRFAIAGPELG
jgi:GNAT superfamily N-acetyltransferase